MKAEKWLNRILVLGAAFVMAFAPLPGQNPAPVARTIRIEASNFAFSPGIVQVNPGDQVTFELMAKDVVHGLYIDGYNLEVSAEPGQTARVTFVAAKSGSYRLRCSVTCGSMHPFMIGKLNVGSNSLFWRASGLALLAALVGFFYLLKPQPLR